jgi:hypothetical protein
MKVLLLSTSRLHLSYFEKVRREFDRSDVVIDVVAWLPPREPVDELIREFLLLGPSEVPKAELAPSGMSKFLDRLHTVPARPVESKPRGYDLLPQWNRARNRASLLWRYKRVQQCLLWRYRRVRQTKVARRLRRIVIGGPSRQFWRRARRHREAQRMARTADLIVVLDGGAVRTGWHLAQRNPNARAVIGLVAAVEQVNVLGRRV